MQLLRVFWRANQCGHCSLKHVNRNNFILYSYHWESEGRGGRLFKGGGDAFLTLWKREQALIRGRALIRAWSLSRGYTVFIICNLYSEQTSSYLKYLMNFCIWHCEHSILRLLHYIVILLIAKILHNYEFELEILILVVLSYCGVSNMVSRRPSF